MTTFELVKACAIVDADVCGHILLQGIQALVRGAGQSSGNHFVLFPSDAIRLINCS